MSGRRVAYLNVRLLDPASGLDAPGGLLTEDGLIADLGAELTGAALADDIETLDCGGRVLCPGLIDMRVFCGEPGAEHKETLASLGQAAAAGGVTTAITMPNTEPVIDNVALVEYVARRARETAAVRVLPMAAISQGLEGRAMTELGLMAEAGAVAFSDGSRAIADALVMRRVLSYASTFGLLIVQYPEEPALARDGVMNESEVAMRLGLPGIPACAETVMVERDLRLVELTGGRYHAALLSTAAAIDALRTARANGLPVSAYRTFAKTDPPLRSEDDRRALVEGLADGTIDVICSSHTPEDAESKRLPFEQAASGIIGLETLLPLALELYHNGYLGLPELIAKMTINPARHLGLPTGRLTVGAPADLLLFDPNVPWRIDENRFRSKSKNSPFDGRPVQGRVWRTVVAGDCVYDQTGDI